MAALAKSSSRSHDATAPRFRALRLADRILAASRTRAASSSSGVLSAIRRPSSSRSAIAIARRCSRSSTHSRQGCLRRSPRCSRRSCGSRSWCSPSLDVIAMPRTPIAGTNVNPAEEPSGLCLVPTPKSEARGRRAPPTRADLKYEESIGGQVRAGVGESRDGGPHIEGGNLHGLRLCPAPIADTLARFEVKIAGGHWSSFDFAPTSPRLRPGELNGICATSPLRPTLLSGGEVGEVATPI